MPPRADLKSNRTKTSAMKIATAAYPLDTFSSLQKYSEKLTSWVREASENGADLLVFPEYGAMELATLAGSDAAADIQTCLRVVSDLLPQIDQIHTDLAASFQCHILAASAPVFDPAFEGPPVNRARLFSPQGGVGVQDKQIMTRFERETWGMQGGVPLQVFDTSLGKIAILICYDSEFPLLSRAVMEADIILVPSCTDALTGYSRVKIGAQARALENQCVTVMSSIVRPFAACPAVDENIGAGGIYGPPDVGFPDTGVIAQGVLNRPGWIYGHVNLGAIARVRDGGAQLNRLHWQDQDGRANPAPLVKL